MGFQTISLAKPDEIRQRDWIVDQLNLFSLIVLSRITQRAIVFGSSKTYYFYFTSFYVTFLLIPIFCAIVKQEIEAFQDFNIVKAATTTDGRLIQDAFLIFKYPVFIFVVIQMATMIMQTIYLCMSHRDYSGQYHDQVERRH